MAPEQKRLLTITRPSDICWRIAFDGPPDNRLTESMLTQLLEALDQVELEWRQQSTCCSSPSRAYVLMRVLCFSGDWSKQFDAKRKGGALILTSEITKFFSNGLDYENSIKNPNFHRGMAC
jgi:enoyl-CoA hydratase/carnithine racemase